MIYSNFKTHPIIRVISVTLIAAFLMQDIVWADPDIVSGHTVSDTLAPQSFLRQSDSPERAVAAFIETAIENNGTITKNNIVIRAIERILKRGQYEDFLRLNGVTYSVSDRYSEVLISFPSGCVLRYFDPGAEDVRGDPAAVTNLGVIQKEVLRSVKPGKSAASGKPGPGKKKKAISSKDLLLDLERAYNMLQNARKRSAKLWKRRYIPASKISAREAADLSVSRREEKVRSLLAMLSNRNNEPFIFPQNAPPSDIKKYKELRLLEIVARVDLVIGEIRSMESGIEHSTALGELKGMLPELRRILAGIKQDDAPVPSGKLKRYIEIIGSVNSRRHWITVTTELIHIQHLMQDLVKSVSAPSPAGAAAEADKMWKAAIVAVPAAVIFITVHLFRTSLPSAVLIVLYLASMLWFPCFTASSMDDALAYKHTAPKDHRGLIKPFRDAKDIRIRQHDPKDPDSKGKLSYYYYNGETDPRRDAMKELYIDKEAMEYVPLTVQWVLYLHEWLHGRVRVKTEIINVPLTYCLPWMAVFILLAPTMAIFGDWRDAGVAAGFFLYNAGVLAFMKICAWGWGTKLSDAGHNLMEFDSKLTEKEIDARVADYVHKSTLDKETGNMMPVREWLKSEHSGSVVLVPCGPESPEDIIVVKPVYIDHAALSSRRSEDLAALIAAVKRSKKMSFRVVFTVSPPAVSGPENGLYMEKVKKAMKTIRGTIKIFKPCSLIRFDVRSADRDITRLKGLQILYNRRTVRIARKLLENEAVGCGVHGNSARLAKLLKWLRDNGYKNLALPGDYLSKEKALNFTALDLIREHVLSGRAPKLRIIIGKSEFVFLLAMLGEPYWSKKWPTNGTMEGPAAIEGLRALSRRVIDDKTPEHVRKDIDAAHEFESVVTRLEREGRGGMEKWYMFHPKLIQLSEFIVNHMAVGAEDEHHSMNTIGSRDHTETFEWRGLKGIEAIFELQREFKEYATARLKILKAAKEAFDTGRPDAEIGAIMSRLTKGEGLFSKKYIDAFMEKLVDSDIELSAPSSRRERYDIRKRQIQEEGVNTTINNSIFVRGVRHENGWPKGIDFMGQVRLFKTKGMMVLITVDSLGTDKPDEYIVMTDLTKNEDRDRTGEGMSLESTTKDKLEVVNGLLADYEPIIKLMEGKSLWRFLDDVPYYWHKFREEARMKFSAAYPHNATKIVAADPATMTRFRAWSANMKIHLNELLLLMNMLADAESTARGDLYPGLKAEYANIERLTNSIYMIGLPDEVSDGMMHDLAQVLTAIGIISHDGIFGRALSSRDNLRDYEFFKIAYDGIKKMIEMESLASRIRGDFVMVRTPSGQGWMVDLKQSAGPVLSSASVPVAEDEGQNGRQRPISAGLPEHPKNSMPGMDGMEKGSGTSFVKVLERGVRRLESQVVPTAPMQTETVSDTTGYDLLLADSERLSGVDGVISDFDGVDREHREAGVSEGVMAVKLRLMAEGVFMATLTGRPMHEFKRVYKQFIDHMAHAVSANRYALFTCAGSEGGIINKLAEISGLDGYAETILGNEAVIKRVKLIVERALSKAAGESGIGVEATGKVYYVVSSHAVTLRLTREQGGTRIDSLAGIRYRMAEYVRNDPEFRKLIESGKIPETTEVTASAEAVDIVATSKGASAMQLIKTKHLKRVALIADSVGTVKNPGNDRSMLAITKDDLRRFGVDWDVDIIKVYVGKEAGAELPEGVIRSPVGDSETKYTLRLYDSIAEAKMRAAQAPISLMPLTKDFAGKNVTRLVGLHNLIMHTHWTEDEFMADLWPKGSYGRSEDRIFWAKWEHSFVAVSKDNYPVGYILAYERAGGENKCVPDLSLYIHGIAVGKNFRNMGIGRRLLVEAAHNLKENGFLSSWNYRGPPHISLQVNANNVDAIRLYEGLGFRRVGFKKLDNGETDYIYLATADDVIRIGANTNLTPNPSPAPDSTPEMDGMEKGSGTSSVKVLERGVRRLESIVVKGSQLAPADTAAMQVEAIAVKAGMKIDQVVDGPFIFYKKVWDGSGDLLTPDEHRTIFEYLWVNSASGLHLPEGLKDLPEGLIDKLVAAKLAWQIQGIINLSLSADDMNRIIADCRFAPGESDIKAFIWRIFYLTNNGIANREYDFVDPRIASVMSRAITGAGPAVRVLDLGCGPKGTTLRGLKKAYGGRIDAYGVDLALEKEEAAENGSGVTLRNADIQNERGLPFDDGYFDCVYELGVLEYYRGAELDAILKEVARMVKPGGIFIFNTGMSGKSAQGMAALEAFGPGAEIEGSGMCVIRKALEPAGEDSVPGMDAGPDSKEVPESRVMERTPSRDQWRIDLEKSVELDMLHRLVAGEKEGFVEKMSDGQGACVLRNGRLASRLMLRPDLKVEIARSDIPGSIDHTFLIVKIRLTGNKYLVDIYPTGAFIMDTPVVVMPEPEAVSKNFIYGIYKVLGENTICDIGKYIKIDLLSIRPLNIPKSEWIGYKDTGSIDQGDRLPVLAEPQPENSMPGPDMVAPLAVASILPDPLSLFPVERIAGLFPPEQGAFSAAEKPYLSASHEDYFEFSEAVAGSMRIFSLLRDGKPAAELTLSIVGRQAYVRPYLEEPYRMSGIGSFWFDDMLVPYLQAHGVEEVTVFWTCDNDNIGAYDSFLNKRGFKIAKRFKMYDELILSEAVKTIGQNEGQRPISAGLPERPENSMSGMETTPGAAPVAPAPGLAAATMPRSKGAPEALLRDMRAALAYSDNRKTFKELISLAIESNIRGGKNHSKNTISKELIFLRNANLVLGGRKGYYLVDWIRGLDGEQFEEFLRNNPGLRDPSPAKEDLASIQMNAAAHTAQGLRLNTPPAASGPKEEAFERLQSAARLQPVLRFQPRQNRVMLGFNLGFKDFISNRVAPVSIIKNRVESPDLFAIVDDLDPLNYIVLKTEKLVGGNLKLTVVGDDNDNAVVDPRHNESPYQLERLKAGGKFCDRLANRPAEARKVDRVMRTGKSKGLYYSHTSFVGPTASKAGISVNLIPVTDESQDRQWLVPGENYESELKGKEVLLCLVDLKREGLAKPSAMPSFAQIAASGGEFIAYPAEGWSPHEWLRIKQGDSYEYFRNIGLLSEVGTAFVVYRRIGARDRITAIHIPPDRRTFTIEGIEMDGKPLVFEAGHLHMGALLYLLTNDDPAELGRLGPSIRSRIKIAPSLMTLVPTLDKMISMGLANIPTAWREEIVGGRRNWNLGYYRTIHWASRWGHEQRLRTMVTNLSDVRRGMEKNIPPAPEVDAGPDSKEVPESRVMERTPSRDHWRIDLEKSVEAASNQMTGAQTRHASKFITLSEVAAVIDGIDPDGNIFNASTRKLLAEKIAGMNLEKGKRALVGGPGSLDYLPVILAKLGIYTSVIDTDDVALRRQLVVYRTHGVQDVIKTYSSFPAMGEARFDYVFMLAMLHCTANYSRDVMEYIRLLYSQSEDVRQLGDALILESFALTMKPFMESLDLASGRIFINDVVGGITIRYIERAAYYCAETLGVTIDPQSVNIDDLNASYTNNTESRKGFVYSVTPQNIVTHVAPLPNSTPGVDADHREAVFRLDLPAGTDIEDERKASDKINDFIMANRVVLTEIEISVEDILNELASNVMEHGKGGVIEIYIADGRLTIIANDNGPGLPATPNELTDRSLAAHKRTRENPAGGSSKETADPGSDRGYCFSRIALDPDLVTIEYGGRRFVMNNSGQSARFTEGGATDVTSGTRFMLEFLLRPAKVSMPETGTVSKTTPNITAPDSTPGMDGVKKGSGTSSAKVLERGVIERGVERGVRHLDAPSAAGEGGPRPETADGETVASPRKSAAQPITPEIQWPKEPSGDKADPADNLKDEIIYLIRLLKILNYFDDASVFVIRHGFSTWFNFGDIAHGLKNHIDQMRMNLDNDRSRVRELAAEFKKDIAFLEMIAADIKSGDIDKYAEKLTRGGTEADPVPHESALGYLCKIAFSKKHDRSKKEEVFFEIVKRIDEAVSDINRIAQTIEVVNTGTESALNPSPARDVIQPFAAADSECRIDLETRPIADDERILLSESLFTDGTDRQELDKIILALAPILNKPGSHIEILNEKDIMKRVTNDGPDKPSKDKVAAILSQEDKAKNRYWSDPGKWESIKATVLFTENKLTGANYLYLTGLIGFTRAVMAQDRDKVARYYKLLTGTELSGDVLKLLDIAGSNNTIPFALKLILKFRPIERIDPARFDAMRIAMENLLISA